MPRLVHRVTTGYEKIFNRLNIQRHRKANMDKKWLDRICDDGIVKCYLDKEILNRTTIGHGGFGVVSKVQLKYTGTTVAMKTLSFTYKDEQELYEKFVNEVCVLLLLLLVGKFLSNIRE